MLLWNYKNSLSMLKKFMETCRLNNCNEFILSIFFKCPCFIILLHSSKSRQHRLLSDVLVQTIFTENINSYFYALKQFNNNISLIMSAENNFITSENDQELMLEVYECYFNKKLIFKLTFFALFKLSYYWLFNKDIEM